MTSANIMKGETPDFLFISAKYKGFFLHSFSLIIVFLTFFAERRNADDTFRTTDVKGKPRILRSARVFKWLKRQTCAAMKPLPRV